MEHRFGKVPCHPPLLYFSFALSLLPFLSFSGFPWRHWLLFGRLLAVSFLIAAADCCGRGWAYGCCWCWRGDVCRSVRLSNARWQWTKRVGLGAVVEHLPHRCFHFGGAFIPNPLQQAVED